MEEVYLTIREAAEKTRLSVAWWRKAIFERRVRYVKVAVGRRVLIPYSTIEALLSKVIEPIEEGRGK